MILKDAIEKAKQQLDDPHYMPSLVAYMLLDYLNDRHPCFDLAWILGHDDNCHKNDVVGLIELLERIG